MVMEAGPVLCICLILCEAICRAGASTVTAGGCGLLLSMVVAVEATAYLRCYNVVYRVWEG